MKDCNWIDGVQVLLFVAHDVSAAIARFACCIQMRTSALTLVYYAHKRRHIFLSTSFEQFFHQNVRISKVQIKNYCIALISFLS